MALPVFKTVRGAVKPSWVGSIPTRSRHLLKEVVRMRPFRNLSALMLAALFVSSLPACKKKPATAATGSQTRVRVVNAVPDTPPLVISAGGPPLFTPLAYKGITPYVAVPPGTFTVTAISFNVNATVFGPAAITLTPNRDHTIVALGTGTAASGTVSPLILTDDNTAPAAGRARVRFVHAASDAPPVDIVLNERVAVSNLRFGAATDVYAEFAAGTYPVKIVPTGAETAVLGPVPLSLQAGGTYLVLVGGRSADRTLNVQVYR